MDPASSRGATAASLRSLMKRNVGFGLFLAWNYIALYGCGMAINKFVPYNLEFIWLVSGATMAVFAGLALGLARHRGPHAFDARWGAFAAICAIAGNIALWLAYAVLQTFWVLSVFAGVLDGVATVIFMAIWGTRLTECNEARTEFDVLACFIVASALYCATLPIKLWGIVDLAVECTLPPLSAWLAFREYSGDPDTAWREGRAPVAVKPPVKGAGLPELAELRAAFATLAVLWFLVAFYRVIDAPIGAYGRYWRYLIAFATGCVVAVALFVPLIRRMRYVNLSTGYRWLIPFVLLNNVVICAGDGSVTSHVIAYAIIHAGMFGMQMLVLISLTKYLRRRGGRPTVVFTMLAAVMGAGIAAGCVAGLATMNLVPSGPARAGVILGVSMLAVMAVMMTGFDPSWFFVRDRRNNYHAGTDGARAAEKPAEGVGGAGTGSAPAAGGVGGGGGTAGAGMTAGAGSMGDVLGAPAGETPKDQVAGIESDYSSMARRGSEALRARYGLTERETEVVALLLLGRSRPYIRDELGISLNTVHAHARSILTKCGVHSQRELIDLLNK